MKADSVQTQRANDAAPSARATARSAADAAPDLFALLLSAAADDTAAAQTPATGMAEAKLPEAKLAEDKMPQARPKDLPASVMELTTKPLTASKDGAVGAQEQKMPEPLAALEWLIGAPASANTAYQGSATSNQNAASTAWSSTVSKGRVRTPTPDLLRELPQPKADLALGQGLSAEPLRGAWHGSPAAAQLAVSLHGALPEPQALGPSGLEGTLSEHAGTHQEHQPGQQRGEPQRVLLESAAATRTSVESAPTQRSFADALGDAMGGGAEQAFRALGDQVSLWAAGQTRKASLLLEAGLRQALEVDVSLNGDQAQLVFRTDDASARDAIKAHAYDLLNEMLQQSGLGLESLSVGARNAAQSDASSQNQDRSEQKPEQAAADNDATATELHLKSWSGAGLSVYV